MGAALLAAAMVMTLTQFQLIPGGGDSLGLSVLSLAVGIAGNLVFGALDARVGLYAPCMILASLLGMNPRAAFPSEALVVNLRERRRIRGR